VTVLSRRCRDMLSLPNCSRLFQRTRICHCGVARSCVLWHGSLGWRRHSLTRWVSLPVSWTVGRLDIDRLLWPLSLLEDLVRMLLEMQLL
jgi:hypothetical protein